MPKVGLFVTCLVDLVRPQVGFSAAKLLEQSLKADDKPARAVLNWLWLALVEQRRGKDAEARPWLEKGTKWLGQYPKCPTRGVASSGASRSTGR